MYQQAQSAMANKTRELGGLRALTEAPGILKGHYYIGESDLYLIAQTEESVVEIDLHNGQGLEQKSERELLELLRIVEKRMLEPVQAKA